MFHKWFKVKVITVDMKSLNLNKYIKHNMSVNLDQLHFCVVHQLGNIRPMGLAYFKILQQTIKNRERQ